MSVTQKQIATELGISHQLVSFALNGGGNVAEKTRQEILATAERMGYRKNELARAIVTGRSHVIGVLTSAEAKEHIGRIFNGVMEAITEQGYVSKVLQIPYNTAPDVAQKTAQKCSEWRLDGVVTVSLRPSLLAKIEAELKNINCPTVYLENSPTEGSPSIEANLVHTDDNSGMQAALEYLIGLKHRHIGFLGGPDGEWVSQRRIQILREGLQNFGLPVDESAMIYAHWFDNARIVDAATRMLDLPRRPTAVICASDVIAMVLMREARYKGLRVPEDLSVVGYGNHSSSEYTDPPLTSIDQPFHNLGYWTVRELIEKIERRSRQFTSFKRPTELLKEHLVLRRSTGIASQE